MRYVRPVPKGFHTINPHLVFKDGQKAVDFYVRAFNAEVIHKIYTPEGKLLHAELRIGDSIIMLADEFTPEPGQEENRIRSPETLNGSTVNFYLYVKDVDEFFSKGVEAGATSIMPVADMFWGDRFGQLKDPFGYFWGVATHVEELTPAEMEERSHQFAMK